VIGVTKYRLIVDVQGILYFLLMLNPGDYQNLVRGKQHKPLQRQLEPMMVILFNRHTIMATMDFMEPRSNMLSR